MNSRLFHLKIIQFNLNEIHVGRVFQTEATVGYGDMLYWQIQAVQDANADGKADLLWLNGATGQYYGYLMNGSQITGVLLNHLVPDLNWHFQANGRFAGNDLLGLLQRHTNGQWRVLQSLAHNTLSYYHNDHLGTPKMLTAQDGKIVWQADYSPFGKVKVTQAWVDNPIRFPGQYHDQETGLYYNYFRYYDPEIGRYLTSDPIGLAGGINTYAYVSNNPINAVDPTGLRASYCQRPLGDYSGENGGGPPLFNHQFICVTLIDGTVRCDSTNNPDDDTNPLTPAPGSPSLPERDNEDIAQCEDIDDDKNRCFEECVLEQWEKPRPDYAIGPLGTDCQEYSSDIRNICEAKCRKKNRWEFW